MKSLVQKNKFGTKAETLKYLDSFLTLFSVPKFFYFDVSEWRKNRENIVKKTRRYFSRDKIIVRSSAYSEDNGVSTKAGLYESVPNVFTCDRDRLSEAITRVISSYKRSSGKAHPRNQVLMQLMVEDISMSGVVFTQDLNTGAPYYVINYDDETGRTDTVTSGAKDSNRTLLVHRRAVGELKSERFRVLLSAVQEVERITGHDSLDIEFAVDKRNNVYLLQARQIPTAPNWNRGITIKINHAISRMRLFIRERQKAIPGIYGARTIFGKMPDWNPAEMIGVFPRPLALSLYRHLITDYAWREARRQMGYFEPRGTRLMVSLSGKPYIDVRLSFNSFLPAGLDSGICDKLVNAWIGRLATHKEFHDKVEFEVAITALSFDFYQSLGEQIPDVLSKKEERAFEKALFDLTDSLLTGRVAPIRGEVKKVKLLERRKIDLEASRKNPRLSIVAGLLEDCIKYGTIPFSILARHAFIAKSFMRSLIRRRVLSESEAASFESSMKTVASALVCEFDGLARGKIKKESFLTKYGHLRPGTYNILSRRYDQREDLINTTTRSPDRHGIKKGFSFLPKQLEKIDGLLKEFGYGIAPVQLLEYIKEAIIAREYAKFIFTKNISDALEIIASWGEKNGLSREELSYLTIWDILDTVNSPQGRTLEEYLRGLATDGRCSHEITLATRLPYLIERPEDISIAPLFLNKPNFITQKTARGPCVFIDGKGESVSDIKGRIVLIESADPGFDWIFSFPLLGLITKFGGANSHMAIRCAEFGLPAAIGCGEQIFDRILRSQAIELSCSEGKIEPIEA
ncbi:MAG: PEP-utilizing enzyme [Omnitrophica bacterium]|nr:PEP-utilizing enzyme [Candidatus Omnitrophota bacterium]